MCVYMIVMQIEIVEVYIDIVDIIVDMIVVKESMIMGLLLANRIETWDMQMNDNRIYIYI